MFCFWIYNKINIITNFSNFMALK